MTKRISGAIIVAGCVCLGLPQATLAGTAYVGQLRGDVSQVLFCNIANLAETAQQITILVFDDAGIQVGQVNSTVDPGHRTFIGVNSSAAAYCKFDYEGLNDSVLISGCIHTGFDAIDACLPVKYIPDPVEPETPFPPGPPKLN